MRIETLVVGDNFVYLLFGGDRAAVVDPGDAGVVLDAMAEHGATLETILVTHHHFDHTAGCRALQANTSCRIVAPADGAGARADLVVRDGDTVTGAGCDFVVMAVPGHTRTHVAYYCAAEEILFTGDTLFAGGCGRIGEGTAGDLLASLNRLAELPDNTRVYCGHEYTLENLEFAAHLDPGDEHVRQRLLQTREILRRGGLTVPSILREEKLTNPFLKCGSDTGEFARIRSLKDRW